MQLSDYAQALGQAQQLVPSWNEPDIQRAQLQGLQAQTQLQQQQVAIGQQEQADAQTFRSDLATLPRNPTADNYRRIAAQHPRYFAQLSGAADKLDATARQHAVSNFSQIGAAITANTPQSLTAAASLIQRHIDADKAAGRQPDEDDVSLLSMLNSGNPGQIRAAGTLVHGTLAALDKDAATALYPTPRNRYGQLGNGGVFDMETGDTVREPTQAPVDALQVPIFDANGQRVGTQLVPNGGRGGGQASVGGAPNGSGAPAGRTQYGWTPRARNGGDNNDAAVDSKNAGMAATLGIGITTPFPASMTNTQIAQALAQSEGGAGSLADRNNNPGNLRNPRTGAYRTFPTKEAGMAAAAAQVGRNRARGQNTIQTMVEGLPVGGSRASAGPSGMIIGPVPAAAPGGDALLPDTTVTTMAQQYLAGDQSVLTNLGRGRQGAANIIKVRSEIARQAAARGMDGAQIAATMQDFKMHQQGLNAFARGPQGNTVRSLNVAVDHLDTLRSTAQALQNGNIPFFNKISQQWARATGSAAPTNFEGVRQIVATEVAKAVTGGNTALADRQDLVHSVQTASSPQQLAGYIAEVQQLMAGQLNGLRQQYQAATGRDDFDSRLSDRTRNLLGGHTAAPRIRILNVRPK